MTNKPNAKRTTIYLPIKLYEEAKKRNINISELCRETLEYEIYQENPDFIRNKLNELDENHKNHKKLLLAKLKVAEENQQNKAKRLGVANDVEVWDYRTTTPPKKGGDK